MRVVLPVVATAAVGLFLLAVAGKRLMATGGEDASAERVGDATRVEGFGETLGMAFRWY